jgi:hypothetical protein
MPTDTYTLAYAWSGKARVVRLNRVTMPNVQKGMLARFIVFIFLLVNYAKPFLKFGYKIGTSEKNDWCASAQTSPELTLLVNALLHRPKSDLNLDLE